MGWSKNSGHQAEMFRAHRNKNPTFQGFSNHLFFQKDESLWLMFCWSVFCPEIEHWNTTSFTASSVVLVSKLFISNELYNKGLIFLKIPSGYFAMPSLLTGLFVFQWLGYFLELFFCSSSPFIFSYL